MSGSDTSSNDVANAPSRIPTRNHVHTNHTTDLSKTNSRTESLVKTSRTTSPFVQQLRVSHLSSMIKIKTEPHQEMPSSPVAKLIPRHPSTSSSEKSSSSAQSMQSNIKSESSNHSTIRSRLDTMTNMKLCPTRTRNIEIVAAPVRPQSTINLDAYAAGVNKLTSRKSGSKFDKKRAFESVDLKLDDYRTIQVDKTAILLQGFQDPKTINPHKKPRYEANQQAGNSSLSLLKKCGALSHLDPCPVIDQLGIAEIGSQLYIAENWESRPGVCDPRVTKLCYNTSDNSIKDYLCSGMATIGAKVFYCDPNKKVKAEGWVTNVGILCSRCGYVLGSKEFKACSGVKWCDNRGHMLLISSTPLKAQNCKF